ncbi:hypothetical protein MHU86_23210 [Fragilaria crotonensis]|nr:hypothetical protein MHU86_23210 [Fragilaria crotonensis]
MHAPCAGSDRVPEGDWFCSKCNASDTKESKLDEKTEVPGQMKAVMIPLDDARARSARKGKGPEDTASDALNQTLDNDDKKKLNLPLEDMQSELDTLLCELRDYRLAQNPARNRKKDDKKEEQQDKITENVANEKESVHDREQETNEDNVIAGKMSTTTMLRRTSVIASERSDEEHPQVSEKGDEPQAIGIGSKVSKDFGENGRFLGVVKALPCEDYPFYKIRYEDGDEEDMDEGELREVLIFIKPPRKRKAIHSDEETPRKRGRTSTQGGSADYSVVKSESARSSASLNETNSPPRPAGKVEFKPGFRSFKPGVRVVPKKLRRQGKTGTIVRSIDRHTWEVRFDDGRKRAPFKSQQLSYLEDVADGFDEKGKWRDKIGTIVKEVSKFTWEVKFDDGIDRGTFKSLQLTFADAGASSQVETAVEDNDDDNHTRSSNRGQSVEFKAGVRVVPKKNIYKFKGATIVRSAGRHKWELKFDDGVDRGLFKTQQLCVLDDNQILPSLDVDTADGVKKEFKVGVRVLPKKRVYQGKLATIIRSCGNHTWELKFDDGVDRGTFTSQQLAYIADSERDAVASSANAHMDFKAGVRVVSKSRIYEGKLGTIVKSVGPEQWTVQFDDGEEPATLTSQQLAVAHSKPGNANSDCDETGQADDVAKTSCEVEGVQKRRRGRPRKAEMLAAIQAVPAIDNDAKSDGYDTGQVDDVAITSHGFDGAQRRRRGRPRKTETLVASTEVLSKSGEKSRVQNSPAVVETRTTPQKRERARRTTTETSIGLGGEGAEAAQRTKRLRTRRSLS